MSRAKTKAQPKDKVESLRASIVAEVRAYKGKDPRPRLLARLQEALADGRKKVRERLEAGKIDGPETARALSDLMDQLVGALFDLAAEKHYAGEPLSGREALSIIATGGYGRRELAPYSDLDLLFLVPKKCSKRLEEVVQFMLYGLWDLGLKIGHATRSIEDCIRLSKDDLTILTSFLDARRICGDAALFEESWKAFNKALIQGKAHRH